MQNLFRNVSNRVSGQYILYTHARALSESQSQTVEGVVPVWQQGTFTLWCTWKGASYNTHDFLSHGRIVEDCSSLVIHTNHWRRMWATASPSPTRLLSPVSRSTPLFSLLSNPHIMAQCVTTWHIIYWYTPVVKGSRCWLPRMSPIVPHGITQRYVSIAVAERPWVCVFNPPMNNSTFKVLNLQLCFGESSGHFISDWDMC